MDLPLRIAPSLLACDFGRLNEELARAEAAGADWHHVDVMDGHFVPNLTIGPAMVDAIKARATVPLDVHLMIEEPARWAGRYADAGADVLTFHYEAARDSFAATLDAFRRTGCRVGVAVNPDCPVDALEEHLDAVDLVLVMSVFAGFGGQAFMDEVLDKVRRLRSCGFAGDLEIDGGINPDTGAESAAAGANCLVAGSYLYGSDDMASALAALRESATAATAC